MAAKKGPRDVLVVPRYDMAVGCRKVGGRRVMPGDIQVISATAGPASIEGLVVGEIHVDERCWQGVLNASWTDEVIESLLVGAEK